MPKNPQALVVRPRKSIERAAPAARELQDAIGSVRQAQQLLEFAKGGGKAAGWSLLGSASGFALAVAMHAQQVATFGAIGSMLALGIYAIRVCQRWNTPRFEQLDDELRDLDALKLTTRITDDEYLRIRENTLKKYGF